MHTTRAKHLKFLAGALSLMLTCFSGCIFPGIQATLGGPGPRMYFASVRWSPDGKKLGFVYKDLAGRMIDRLGAHMRSGYHVYTIDIDSKKHQKTHEPVTYYQIFQWAPYKNMLAGDYLSLDQVDETGRVDTVFEPVKRDPRLIYYNYIKSCRVGSSAVPIVGSSGERILFFDQDAKDMKVLSYSKDQLGEIKFTSNILCSQDDNIIYFSAYRLIDGQKKPREFLGSAKFDSISSSLQDIKIVKDFVYNSAYIEQKQTYNLKFLGWIDKNRFVYAFEHSDELISAYEHDISTKESKERPDVKISGEYSPDFKQVAYTEDVGWHESYLVVSNLDGTNKQRLIKVQDLPDGLTEYP